VGPFSKQGAYDEVMPQPTGPSGLIYLGPPIYLGEGFVSVG